MCTYLEAMDRALKHVLDCGSVALPSGVCPSVEGYETPEAQRPFSPFGDFHNPAPFSTDRTGYLMLHPLGESCLPVPKLRVCFHCWGTLYTVWYFG